MKVTYNISNKTALAEPYLKSSIVPNAKRNQNSTHLRGRTPSHSLWRDLSYSSVLQKAETEVAFAKKGCFPSTFQPLSSSRINPSYHLCSDCWHSSVEQNQDSSRQWRFSTNHWPEEFSICQQSETLSQASRSQNNPRYQQSSRSFKVEDILSPKASNQPPFRSRFRCLYHLRQTDRRSQDRLQSSQKRCQIISSLALLRVSFQRLLAWHLKARRYFQLNWLSGIFKRMFRQTSSLCISYQVKSRFRIFQPQIHRNSRGQKYWLCHRGKNDQSYQEPGCWIALSSFQERLGSCRVSIYPLSMEKAISLYCYPQTTTRKGFRPTESLHQRALCLSGICNQSSYETPKYLVFLQRPSTHRKEYQRTRRKFCPSQDSNQQLSGKSSLFLSASFCLQHCQLVQEALSTSEISECYFRNYSNRVLGITSQISQNGQPECTQIASGVYLQTNTGSYYSEN